VLLAIALVVVLVLAHDAAAMPSRQWSNRALLGLIDVYQATASPLMPSLGVQCRFEPTCSRYSEAVLRTRGIFRGGALAALRILRCGPWTARGTIDPPPPVAAQPPRDRRPPDTDSASRDL
jgi:putative membrane protein insertion efficiency factor